jgi:hypothetical protein
MLHLQFESSYFGKKVSSHHLCQSQRFLPFKFSNHLI